MKNVKYFLIYIFLLSCTENKSVRAVDDNKDKFVLDTTLTAITDCSPILFNVDTIAVAKNKNLPKLLIGLQKDSLISYDSADRIPPIALCLIKKITNSNSFDIANKGEEFTRTDVDDRNIPSRQLTYLGIGKEYVLMTYYVGGFGMADEILIFKINNKVEDFWTGYISDYKQIHDKNHIIKYLNDNVNNHKISNYGFFL